MLAKENWPEAHLPIAFSKLCKLFCGIATFPHESRPFAYLWSSLQCLWGDLPNLSYFPHARGARVLKLIPRKVNYSHSLKYYFTFGHNHEQIEWNVWKQGGNVIIAVLIVAFLCFFEFEFTYRVVHFRWLLNCNMILQLK